MSTELLDVLLQFGTNTVMVGGENVLHTTALNLAVVNNIDYTVIDNASISLSYTGSLYNSTGGRGNTADPTNTDISLFNNAGLLDNVYTKSGVLSINLSTAGIQPAKTYTIGITASRAVTNTDRVTTYTAGGISVTLDAILDPPGQVYINSILGSDLIADGVTYTNATSVYGYLSLLRITLDLDEPEAVNDAYDVTDGVQKVITAPGILTNDTYVCT